jgi:MYXO-CTERM domain-containing protein
MSTRLRKLIRAAAAAGLTSIASIGTTHAALYGGSWDPAYGDALPNIGWRATAQLFVPTACGANIGSGIFTAGSFGEGTFGAYCNNPSPDGAVELRNVRVEFYNLLNPGPTLQTLLIGSFGLGGYGGYGDYGDYREYGDDSESGDSNNVETQKLSRIRFVDGVPVEFSTTYSFRRLVEDASTFEGDCSATNFECPFSLRLSLNNIFGLDPRRMGMMSTTNLVPQNFNGAGSRVVFYNNFSQDLTGALNSGNGSTVDPTSTTFNGPGIVPSPTNAVPEPSALPLALLALGAAAAASRRRRG